MAVAEKEHAGIPNSEAPDETKDDVRNEVPMLNPPDVFDFKPSPDVFDFKPSPDLCNPTLEPPKDIKVPSNLELWNFSLPDPVAPLTTSPDRRENTPEEHLVKFSIIAACNEVVDKNIKMVTSVAGNPPKKTEIEVKPEEEIKTGEEDQQIKTLHKPLDPELLAEEQFISKSQLREEIPDPNKDVLFKQNKQEKMADKDNDGLAEPKDTKIFEIQDVKSKGKSLIDNLPTRLNIAELCAGISKPKRLKKSNQSKWKKLISHKRLEKLMRMDASTSKPKEAENSENEDTKKKSKEGKVKKISKGKRSVSTSNPKAAESMNIEDTESEPEQNLRQSSAPKQQRKIESASSSDLSLSTPEPVKAPKCRKSNKLKLINHTRDKIVQANLMHKNLTGSTKGNEAKSSDLESNEPKPKVFKKRRDSLALEHLRGIETASPELGEGASEPSRSRRFNKMKLLPNTSKNQTNKKRFKQNKKIASSSRQTDNSDFDDIESDSAENLYESSALEPPRQQLGNGTSELIRTRKYKRSNRYRNLSKKNKLKMVARKDIASTSKANNDESSETSGPEYQEKNDSQLTELSEGTPEPIQPPKRKRPSRMSLLPGGPKKYNKKKLLKEKVETSELEESEIDIIVEEMKAIDNQTTPEPRNDSERSQSLDLSEGTPEPIKPPKSNRAPRMKLLPASGSARLLKKLSTKERKDRIRTQNSPTQLQRKSNSPSEPTTSARAQARTASTSGHLSPKARLPSKSGSQAAVSRTFPRTRVLVTPERKQKKDASNKQRRLAEKRKWIREFCQKRQKKSDLRRPETSCETSSDSGNIGDCSGPGEDDDNDSIGDGGAKGDNGGSGSIRGMGDRGHNKGGTADDSDSE